MDRASHPKTPAPPRRGVGRAGLLPLLILAACADFGQLPGMTTETGTYRVGPAYEIDGVAHHPVEDFAFDDTGIAGIYPAGRDGRLTANGELYRSDRLSAAHPTLQLPSLVRVTHLETGRSVVVRVNDRGAFDDTLIELSPRAATYLGIAAAADRAPVRVQILGDESLALATRAGRDGPPPAFNVARQDPLIARHGDIEAASTVAETPTQSAPPAETAVAHDPLLGEMPTADWLPPADVDPLMATTAVAKPVPPSTVASAAIDQRTPPMQPAAQFKTVASDRWTLTQIYTDQVEAALLAPLLVADGSDNDPAEPRRGRAVFEPTTVARVDEPTLDLRSVGAEPVFAEVAGDDWRTAALVEPEDVAPLTVTTVMADVAVPAVQPLDRSLTTIEASQIALTDLVPAAPPPGAAR